MFIRIVYFLLLVFALLANFPNYAASLTHHPQDFLVSIAGKPDEGQQIVNHFCASCHAMKPLINLGAPRIGQKSDWLLRVNQGLDVLFKHTTEGYNAMPPRGGCFECSDEQLKKAIQVLLPPVQKNAIKDDK